MTLNLASLLQHSAEAYRGEIALIQDETRLTYDQLDERVRRFASALIGGGFTRGQKVAIMVPNVPAFTIAYFGTLYVGGTVIALCTLLAGDEVEFQLENSETDVLVLHESCAPAGLPGFQAAPGCRRLVFVREQGEIDPPPEAEPFDRCIAHDPPLDAMVPTDASETAVIMYTSGTTGRPKGAELTPANLHENALYSARALQGSGASDEVAVGPGSAALATLPMYHCFGQTVVQNGLLARGGTLTYLRRFTPEAAVEIIVRDRVTFFAGVPTMYVALLHYPQATPEALASLESCASGGAALPIEVKEEFHRRFGRWIREGYGLTETSPVASFQDLGDATKAGTIGKPIPGVEFRIVDPDDQTLPQGERGEVCIRGYNVMKGYYRDQEATATVMRGGWFHSGDIAYQDDDGDYRIVGRLKEMILRGGFNVYPREVEEVLYAHPAVREAAVIGVPHDRLGEDVKAVVALMPGKTATEEELIAHCKAHVAAYKYPRSVQFMDELPKGSTGKILKRELSS